MELLHDTHCPLDRFKHNYNAEEVSSKTGQAFLLKGFFRRGVVLKNVRLSKTVHLKCNFCVMFFLHCKTNRAAQRKLLNATRSRYH